MKKIIVKNFNSTISNKEELQIFGDDLIVSDEYNSFQELYAQKILLFIALMKQNKEIAWKSRNFEKDGWFIGGIDFETGTLTCPILESYWELLDILEKEDVQMIDSTETINRLTNLAKS